MSFYSPNFATTSSWKTSVNLITSQLRKIKFVVESTFQWGDFDPETSFSGMASSAYLIRRARYLKIWKFLWFSIDIAVTLGGPASNAINMNLPFTVAGATGEIQAGGARIDNAATAEVATWACSGGQSTLAIYKASLANYALAATRIYANGFVEVT